MDVQRHDGAILFESGKVIHVVLYYFVTLLALKRGASIHPFRSKTQTQP